ncbi:MAG: hypothetical protein V9E99_18250 [Microthrixaceae bacterium]|jgi:hypothetical protein
MTIAERLVDRAATRIARRGFLGRAALVGSAAVVAPVDYLLRPTSAYAAICGPQSLCRTGYTEFCCTITGVNACPAGTVTGGWWKVDGSHFCGGAPRYYLDCNAQCGGCGCGSKGICDGSCSGTGCGCANGDCNNWKAGCNKFRYGQCNQHIECLGPIVCRVATCTPPWMFDASCTTAARTDENTRYHSRPCLEESFGAIDVVRHDGGELEIGGWAINQDDYRDTALVRVYVDGVVVADVLAGNDRPDVGAAFPTFGSRHGFHLRARVAPGRRYVCIYALDRESGRASFLNFREVDVPAPLGSLDVCTRRSDGTVVLAGWAHDPTRGTNPPHVRLVVDETVVSEFDAAGVRPDVAAAIGRDPHCGFTVILPVGTSGATGCLEIVDRFGGVTRIVCRPIGTA